MTRALVVVPAGLSIEAAARLARRHRARVLAARLGARWAGVTRAGLDHALRLGLETVPIRAILWLVPITDPGTPEVVVRRRLEPGMPFLLVAGSDGPAGAVLADEIARPTLRLSLADQLERLRAPIARLLVQAGAIADTHGWPVAAVGGLVRDLLRGGAPRPPGDLDLTVQGDARILARALAEALAGEVRDRPREHPTFLTATVDLARGHRVDVTTARRERYRVPGALPEVEPASLEEDLWRRDFSVNALAVRLDRGAWGQVLDPTAGLEDLRRRRIRVLHPMSFIEDPTRLFRAVRFAVRLGGRLEPATRRLFAEAVRLAAYPALSGDRLRAELTLARRQPDAATVLTRLGRMGAFRLLLPRYRFASETETRLDRVAALSGRLPVTPETEEALHLLALTAHLGAPDRDAWLARLGLAPGQRAALERAVRRATDVLGRLAGARGADDAYATLRHVPELPAAWTRVCAGRSAARTYVERYLVEWRAIRPLVTGDDLQALGLVPGPAVGRLLDELRAAQATGRIRTRSAALRWARRAVALTGEGPRLASATIETRPTRAGRKGG